ncbi:MarR family transcriptional regulator [Candidatus Bathyarchaeota archaeon]|nr:MarR family transcriptional regulator [Candidatus Bathyarchaeota archaeon]
MSEEKISKYNEKMENLLSLGRAPSQFSVFLFLLESGRIMTVREVSEHLDLTTKATERAIAKLVDKGLVMRSTFREASYKVDSNELMVSFLLAITELYDMYQK